MIKLPDQQRVILTIKSRIKEIDRRIAELRSRQQGLEDALGIALGEQELVEGKVQ